MVVKRIKGVIVIVVVLCTFLSACEQGTGKNSQIKNLKEWDGLVEKGVLKKIKIPFLSNISEMSLYGDLLLLQQEKMDTSFVLWNVQDSLEQYIKFGQVGQGPSDVLRTALLFDESETKSIRILDGMFIKSYKKDDDSIVFVGKEKCKSAYNFYRRISVVRDSLCCVKISSPHETGLYLMNIYSGNIYDSISVKQGYFENKDVPWDFNYCLYNNKLVLGRSKFNQFEVYKLMLHENRFILDYIINYKGASPEHVTRKSACYMRDVVADDECFYLLNQDTENYGKETYLDIYKWEGIPLKRIVLDDLYLQMVLQSNKIYLKKYSDDENIYMLEV